MTVKCHQDSLELGLCPKGSLRNVLCALIPLSSQAEHQRTVIRSHTEDSRDNSLATVSKLDCTAPSVFSELWSLQENKYWK